MSGSGQIVCVGCGKGYRWKPDLAGKRMRCKCGAVITVPPTDPAGEPREASGLEGAGSAGIVAGAGAGAGAGRSMEKAAEPDPLQLEFELAETVSRGKPTLAVKGSDGGLTCPGCKGPVTPAAVLCTKCGLNLKTGKRLTSATERARDEADSRQRDRWYMLQQREIPLGLLALGLIIRLYIASQGGGGEEPVDLTTALLAMLIETGLGVGLLIGGCFLGARILETNFGSLGSAILKLAAIYILPSACGALLGVFIDPDVGWMIAWPVQYALFFGLMMWLFDLDVFEVGVMLGVFIVINHLLAFVIASSLMTGSGAESGEEDGSMDEPTPPSQVEESTESGDGPESE